jgi:hypothetical protein
MLSDTTLIILTYFFAQQYMNHIYHTQRLPLERHGVHWARILAQAHCSLEDLSGIYGNAVAYELTFRIHSRVAILRWRR